MRDARRPGGRVTADHLALSIDDLRGALDDAAGCDHTEPVLADSLRTVLDALAAQTERAEAAERERDGLRTVLGDVYALATGDTDGNPRPADAASQALAAVAKLHGRCDDLDAELSDIADALDLAPTDTVAAAVRGLVLRCQEAEHKRDEWEESAAIEKCDADRHRRAHETLAGAVRAYLAADKDWHASRFMLAEQIDQAAVDLEALRRSRRDDARAALDALLTGGEVGDVVPR